MEIQTIVSWGQPKRLSTSRGIRLLRTAEPTERFWTAYRADKEALKAAGVSVRKNDRTGTWEAQWWQEDAQAQESIQASAKTDAVVDVPSPDGYEYMPFQRAGIAYASARPATLIADEMGLGKTIQALGVINADPTIKRALVLCPASLRLNWQREAERWLVRPMTIQVIEGKKPVALTGDMIILNYDIIAAHRSAIDTIEWDILIADEAHYLKNGKAARTQAVVGKTDKNPEKRKPAIRARRRLLLTGTPIVNRPVELWTLAHYLAPEAFSSFFSYAKKYCGAVQGQWGWDMSGATNLDQLQDMLRASCMVRRLKKDVLTELPAKRRQIVELPANGASSAVRAEASVSSEWEGRLNDLQARLELAEVEDGDTSEILAAIKAASTAAFTEMAQARHDTAVAKIPYCVDHIAEAVESSGQVVVFAHHHDMVDGLKSGLTERGLSVVTLTGQDKMEDRQAAVDAFQAGQAQVFIGSIAAAGVGLTLTQSSHVIFCELPWTPAELSQAEDRCHRIGQTESVLVQHIVLDGSIDQRMAQALVDKQEIIDRALDVMVRQKLSASPVMPTRERRGRTDFAALAEKMTEGQRQAAHAALKQLAAMDQDHARWKNGIGFSAVDGKIGHDLAGRETLSPKQTALAAKIAWKYNRTQIEIRCLEPLFAK